MIRFDRVSASENGDVQSDEHFVLCSVAQHACSPLLQGGLQEEEEVCKVALACHFALDVILPCQY